MIQQNEELPNRRMKIFVVFLSFFTCVLPAVVFLFALAHQQLQGQLYIFGICAVIAFVLSAVTVLSRSMTRRMVLPALAFTRTTLFISVLFTILIIVDYVQKCSNYLPLSSRWTHLLYLLDCNGALFAVFVAAGLVMSLGVLVMSFMMRRTYLHVKESLKPKAVARAAVSSLTANRPLVSSEVSMSPKIRAKAYAPFVTAFAIAMIVLIIFFWVTFKRIDHEVPGECPSGDIFYTDPYSSDLSCCQWFNNGSCVQGKRGVDVCQLHPSYNDAIQNQVSGSPCDDLLGLMSCAMYNPESGKWLSWAHNNVTRINVCPQFAAATFTACSNYTSKVSGDLVSAFGSPSVFFKEAFVHETQEITVANLTNDDCFNSAPGGAAPTTALVVAAAVAVLALSRR